MAIPHAKSGDLVRIALSTTGPWTDLSRTLIRDDHIEVFSLAMLAGTQMQEHRAAGAMTLQCLSGEITLFCHDQIHTLQAGNLVYLQDAEPHSVQCVSDAVLLITLVLHRR
ncbi:cupin domain-containing protein [Chitinimonas naiadis]